jgi:magnesium-transporting ATPase (P-type)
MSECTVEQIGPFPPLTRATPRRAAPPQFQLTVNVTALVTCLAGAVTGFGTPLKPVQLLWVNLIMDTLGALALATELPTPDMLLRKPYGRNDKLVSGRMWRSILVQSFWQLFFCLGILFGTGPAFKLWDCVPKGKYVGGSTTATRLSTTRLCGRSSSTRSTRASCRTS